MKRDKRFLLVGWLSLALLLAACSNALSSSPGPSVGSTQVKATVSVGTAVPGGPGHYNRTSFLASPAQHPPERLRLER